MPPDPPPPPRPLQSRSGHSPKKTGRGISREVQDGWGGGGGDSAPFWWGSVVGWTLQVARGSVSGAQKCSVCMFAPPLAWASRSWEVAAEVSTSTSLGMNLHYLAFTKQIRSFCQNI